MKTDSTWMKDVEHRTKSFARSSPGIRSFCTGAFEFFLAAWILAFCCFIFTANARGEAKEYDLKAFFLFNFAQFVDWPPDAFPNARSPLVIGVLGEDPFGKSLKEAVRGETIRNRKLAVKKFRKSDDFTACQILYISPSENGSLGGILAGLKGKPVLTVGETDGFALAGGMIRFVNDQDKIRFRINKDAVTAARLTMSSKLLKAAQEIVETKPK